MREGAVATLAGPHHGQLLAPVLEELGAGRAWGEDEYSWLRSDRDLG